MPHPPRRQYLVWPSPSVWFYTEESVSAQCNTLYCSFIFVRVIDIVIAIIRYFIRCHSGDCRANDVLVSVTLCVCLLLCHQDSLLLNKDVKYLVVLNSVLLQDWWRSLVVRTPVLAGELSLSCSRLMAGRMTTLWVKRPLSVNQHGQLSQPSLPGRLNE